MKQLQRVKRSKKKFLIVGVIATLVAIGISFAYLVKNDKTGEVVTYQNEQVPFTFDYPESWTLTKKTDNDNDTHIKYVAITATNTSMQKRMAEIRYNTYTATAEPDIHTTGTDCENKKGGYESQCSYVLNPLMEHGYFYRNIDTDYWRGKFKLYKTVGGKKVFDKTVSITLTLFDNNTSSKNDLINLAKSITPVTN